MSGNALKFFSEQNIIRNIPFKNSKGDKNKKIDKDKNKKL